MFLFLKSRSGIGTFGILVIIAGFVLLGIMTYALITRPSAPTTEPSIPPLLVIDGTFVPGGASCRRFKATDGRFYTVTPKTATTSETIAAFSDGVPVRLEGQIVQISLCAQDITIRVGSVSRVVTSTIITVDTTAWKTFTNAQYGVTFRYPETLDVVTRSISVSDPAIFRYVVGTPGSSFFSANIAVYKKFPTESLSEWRRRVSGSAVVTKGPAVRTIRGYSALDVTTRSGTSTAVRSVFFEESDLVIGVDFENAASLVSQERELEREKFLDFIDFVIPGI